VSLVFISQVSAVTSQTETWKPGLVTYPWNVSWIFIYFCIYLIVFRLRSLSKIFRYFHIWYILLAAQNISSNFLICFSLFYDTAVAVFKFKSVVVEKVRNLNSAQVGRVKTRYHDSVFYFLLLTLIRGLIVVRSCAPTVCLIEEIKRRNFLPRIFSSKSSKGNELQTRGHATCEW